MNSEKTDEMLIQAYMSGDCESFTTLYERYKMQLYAYLNRLLPGQRHLADDMFQQTWVKIIHQLPKYRSERKFLAWAMTIAHNLTMDHFRRSKKELASEAIDDAREDVFDEMSEPWSDMDRGELSKALEWALGKLSPELREVFLLRQEDLSFKEIAELQKCSLNTALGRMQYAMRNLQKLLGDWRKGVGR